MDVYLKRGLLIRIFLPEYSILKDIDFSKLFTIIIIIVLVMFYKI